MSSFANEEYLESVHETSYISSFEFEILENISSQIEKVSNGSIYAKYLILLSGINYVLYRYMGNQNITIGISRPQQSIENCDIFDISIIENEIFEEYSYKEYLKNINQIVKNTLSVSEQNNFINNVSKDNISNVVILMNNKYNINKIDFNKTSIAFAFSNRNSSIRCKVYYNANKSTGLLANQIVACLNTFYSLVLSNPNNKLSEIDLLSEVDKQQILFEYNNTKHVYPNTTTIQQLFEEKALLYPQKTAIVFRNEEISYEEVNKRANQLARKLRDKEVGPDTPIAIMVERSIEMVVGILAILKAGGAYLPIDPEYPQDRLEYLFNDSKANIILTQTHLVNKLTYGCDVMKLDEPELFDGDYTNPKNVNRSNDLAYIIYTSGTTGRPKGVMVEHRSVVNILLTMQDEYPLLSEDSYLLKTSYTFDVSVTELFGWFVGYGKLVILEKEKEKSPKSIIEAINRSRITHINFVPSMLSLLLDCVEMEQIQLRSLKYVFSAGEALSLGLVNRYLHILKGPKLENLYGPTETTIYATKYSVKEGDLNLNNIPIGKPLNNMGAYIIDHKDRLLPIGAIGELCISGEGLSRGYINMPELTEEKFVRISSIKGERIYKTGDIARLLPNGNIEFLGRKDHQVKIRGYRIEPGEIENCILQYDSVKEVVVIPRDGKNNEKYLCGYIIADNNISIADLKEFLGRKLPTYMIPSFLIQRENFPLKSNGKMDRNALPYPQMNLSNESQLGKPQNKIEEKLLEIWREELSVDNSYVDSSFFELGGHSLSAASLIMKIQRIFNIELTLNQVFEMPTVRKLAKYIIDLNTNTTASYITSIEEKEYYVATKNQERLYYISQLDGVSTTYNVTVSMIIEGELDTQKLDESIQKLIKRHEILRTSFKVNNGEVLQKINYNLDFGIELHDRISQNNDVDNLIKEFVQPFDLNKAPLFRMGLVKLEKYKHIFIMDFHHIIIDGISADIVINELFNIYNDVELPSLKLQYKDYAEWQANYYRTDLYQKQKEYWRSQFSDGVPKLDFPIDCINRPTRQNFSGERISLGLSKELVQNLKDIAKQTETTLYMVLLAAWNVLLYKYTDQTDIAVGTFMSGRLNASLENMVGMFVNTVILRNRFEGSNTFKQLLNKVRINCLQAYENQNYQFSELIDEFDRNRDISRNPLFDIAFVMQNSSILPLENKDLCIKLYSYQNRISKFDMTLEVIERKDQITVELEYNTALFRSEKMESMVKQYLEILKNVTRDIEIKIDNLEVLLHEERHNILINFNNTETFYDKEKTVHQLFEEQAISTPDNVALVCGKNVLTYRELNELSNKGARILKNQGVKRGDTVAIIMERSMFLLVGILSVLKAGATYLPIDSKLPENRINFMLRDSGADVILTDYVTQEKLIYNRNIVCLSNIKQINEDNSPVYNSSVSTDLAYIIYTSGSTGNPKGVMIEHHSIVNFITGICNTIDFESLHSVLSSTTISFDIFVLESILPLLKGLKVILVDDYVQKEPKLLCNLIKESKVDILQMTPSGLQLLLNSVSDINFLENTRYILIGGEPFPENLLRRIKGVTKARIFNMYGPTESTVWSTVKELTYSDAINIGRPISNTRIYILSEKGNTQPIGVPGELYIGGASLARGYLNQPELTTQKFISNPFVVGERIYRTGDFARWVENGEIEFLGRKDHQVKIRGYRIELGEIESLLQKFDMVRETVVVAKKDELNGSYLCAYFTADKEIAPNELKLYLRSLVPEYMIPSYFTQIHAMPVTANGKIDRNALSELVDQSGNTGFEMPSCKTEQLLVEIWREVLRIDNIGIECNFFDLGGHSLRAGAVCASIHKEFNVEITINDIFNMPTIRELARYIKELETNSFIPIQEAEAKEYYELSGAQRRIFTLQQFDTKSIVYNVPSIFLIEGKLDKQYLENAFINLIQRHEVLRTSFESINGQIIQRVNSRIRFNIEHSAAEESDIDLFIRGFVRPFDLSCAPLIRVGLASIKNTETHDRDKYMLIVDIHHMITDGISIRNLFDEVLREYKGEIIREPKLQYRDYLVWCKSLVKSLNIKQQENFWLQVFQNGIPVLNMPTDFPRPLEKNFEGDRICCKLDDVILTRLRNVARENGISIFMLLLAAFSIVLSKYSNQEDIVIGTPVSGRNHADLHDMVGLLINTIALRVYPKGHISLREYLKEIKYICLNAFMNQDYQFDDLVDLLKIKRDNSRNPIFDVMLVMQNIDLSETEIDGMHIHKYRFNEHSSQFDIVIEAMEQHKSLELNICYSTKLYKKETIIRMSKHLMNSLMQISENLDIQLNTISILDKCELEEIVYNYNNTEQRYLEDTVIHQLFEKRAKDAPHNIAVFTKNSFLSYEELNNKANQLAWLLKDNGVGKGSIVGIYFERSIDMIIGVLAILKAGGVYVPFEPSAPTNRIKGILSNLHVQHIITHRDNLKKVQELQWELEGLDNIYCIDLEKKEFINSPDYWDSVKQLWDHISESAVDSVTAGGFISAYTGEPFSELEVNEYKSYVTDLVKPYLGNDKRVLEIGCGSGTLMFELAPMVREYIGLDPSKCTQTRNSKYLNNNKFSNITLVEGFAHDIALYEDHCIDIILIASTVQFFPNIVYLDDIIEEILRVLKPGGILILSDIMDLKCREDYKNSINKYRETNILTNGNRIKLDFNSELYIDQDYFSELASAYNNIESVEVHQRQNVFQNELKYRYDVVIKKRYVGRTSMPKGRNHMIWTREYMDIQPIKNLSLKVEPEDTAYIIYTSGSTGVPKGVEVQHKPVINVIEWVNRTFKVQENDKLLFITSICFDLSVYDIFGMLAAGGSIRVASREELQDPEELMRVLCGDGISIWDSAPAALQQLSAFFPKYKDMAKTSDLRLVLLSGDWIPVKLPDEVRKIFKSSEIVSLGGATEATIWSNYYRIGKVSVDWTSIPYGKPIQNAKYYILNNNMQPCPIGVPGNLYIGGECLAKGYINDKVLTNEKFIYNPFVPGGRIYRTGDIARWMTDGNIEFLGRIDNQVKIRGYRIELGEIENKILQYEGVRETLVIARNDGSGDKQLCAYIVGEVELDIAKLKEYLIKELPVYMIPTYFIPINQIPINQNGKVDRKALPDPMITKLNKPLRELPHNETEQKLFDAWRYILGVEDLDINDNFFELGGHSIKAISLVAQIYNEMQIEVPLNIVFKYPTVKGIAAYIKDNIVKVYEKIKVVEEAKQYSTTSAQKRMFILNKFAGLNVQYNIASALHIIGCLNKTLIDNALRDLMKRHEILCTCFDLTDEGVIQIVDKKAELDIVNIKIKACDVENMAKEFIRPFELSKAPLFRVCIAEINEHEHFLVIDMHHIISDGMSLEILIKELVQLYEGKSLPQLNIQYKDFSVWHNRLLASDIVKNQENYWIGKFADNFPKLNLPMDYMKTSSNILKGERVKLTFENKVVDELIKFTQSTKTTLYMVLIAAYNILLSKITGQEDIIIGSPVSGRHYPGVDKLIGVFVNTIAIRNKPTKDMTIEEFIEDVKNNVIAALENQDYQFEDLIEKLKVKREFGKNPLFNTIFSYNYGYIKGFATQDIIFEPYDISYVIPKFDIEVEVVNNKEILDVIIDYNAGMFKRSTMERLIKYYEEVVIFMIKYPTRKIRQVDLVKEK